MAFFPASIRGRRALLTVGMVLLSIAMGGIDAAAHGRRAGSGAEPSGLAIPGLTHGEMAVLEPFSGEIAALARRVYRPEETFRRLVNYRAIQFSYCGWGMAPGAVTDEESPFNECAHAYISADKAILLHMRDIPQVRREADALISRIDTEMVLRGASFIACQYSGEEFNTADFITPHWENLPTHWPSLLALAAPVALLAGSATAFRLRDRSLSRAR